MSIINIAIDGPAGAGKSTVAKRIAEIMHLTYVDTGAMYRALGLKAVRNGIDPGDAEAVAPILTDTTVTFIKINGEQHVVLDGEDVNELIRTEEISHAASVISTLPEVRRKLVDLQREIARSTDTVMDGRDIGTVVLPNTPYKFYVTASAEVRAKRRFVEYQKKGILGDMTYEDVLNEVKARDERDMNREFSPLRPAENAVIIDTSEMSIDEAVDAVIEDID
ncbi:MAG: (d)CMP kinase [Clostridiales bacterium]|nr:(d)CMP kinase [Clostridiales bacterium]MDY5702736.1 (d)CMP kinase [Eubacteriales bacterium]